MNYVNKFGLYDVKPVKEDLAPTGNDGFILTAYAKKLGLPVDMEKLLATYSLCLKSEKPLRLIRLPGKETPHASRDVILGLYLLGLVDSYELEASNWNFSPFDLPKRDTPKLIKQLLDLRGKHRNHFWQNPGYDQVYHVAFSVPIQDRYFYLKKEKRKIPLLYKLYYSIHKLLKPSNNSSWLIAWAKDERVPSVEVFKEYFGENHPIYLAYRSKNEKNL